MDDATESTGPADPAAPTDPPDPAGSASRTRRRLPARDLALIALFAGLIAALGLPGTLYVFGGAVPITAQSLGVMLAGSILGAKRGALAVLVFLALAMAGLPLLAGGRTGMVAMAGPSAGFVIGFVFGAFVTGWLTERRLRRNSGRYGTWFGLLANMAGGIGVVYAFGLPVMAWRADVGGLIAAAVSMVIFLPGDAIKVVVATAVARGVHAGYPPLAQEFVGSSTVDGRGDQS